MAIAGLKAELLDAIITIFRHVLQLNMTAPYTLINTPPPYPPDPVNCPQIAQVLIFSKFIPTTYILSTQYNDGVGNL